MHILALAAFLIAGSAFAQSPSPAASPAASGATIEGKIAVDEPPHTSDAPARDDEAPFSNVLVYLDGFPPGTTFPPPSDEGSMKQKKKRFYPYILPVQVGGTVRFPNEDDIFHNVFSLSQVQPFNIGRYPKGPGKTVTFTKVGRIRVFCDIHSFMKANILVLPSPHFAFPKPDGTFRLENVPAGTYWVTAWHERLKAQQKPVTIKPGETVKLEFAIK
jgi:hypothetical protein